jgi:hypothetical protein
MEAADPEERIHTYILSILLEKRNAPWQIADADACNDIVITYGPETCDAALNNLTAFSHKSCR